MKFFRQAFLVLFTLVLSGEQIFAANSEQRAFTAATAAFQAKLWNRAEMEFAQFRRNFPDSTNAPQAILLQAQSEFQQKKFGDAISLLKANLLDVGAIQDQFVYWIGESQFASSNYLDAADTLVSVSQTFPDSPLAVRGIVEAAAAQAQLGNWPQVRALLVGDDFQRASKSSSSDETIQRGQLLLAQAEFEQKHFDAAANVLESVNAKAFPPQLQWQRADLLCRVKAEAGDFPAALAVATNLFQIAERQHDKNLMAESKMTQAELLVKMDRPADAILVCQENLKPGVPMEWQRQAILKAADIYRAQNQLTNATQQLVEFLQQYSNAPAADMALLTLGEFRLKSFVADRSDTVDLLQARTNFDQFILTFTNSSLLGKTFLDRGWCNWFAQDITNSLGDFEMAAQKLPPSEDLAVAKFKAGDALFALGNFAAARTNYDAVLTLSNFPTALKELGGRALYQSLRASLERKDFTNAMRAMVRLVTPEFRASELTPNAELLYAEGLGDWGKPAAARQTFESFEQQFPGKLQPQVELAIARTYELEHDWPAAISRYQNWLAEFPTNELVPRASYSLAWANYQADNETNAAALFQNFVAQFHDDRLAPQAQFWLGDYFFRNKEFVGAETNYERVYQDWPASDLAYSAQLMAGRAAMGRGGNSDAIKFYFKNIVADTNCPADIAVQARFGWGSALMASDSGTTNPVANFYAATNIFAGIVQMYPANDYGALAWCYIGECDVQISDYDSATNAYAEAFNSTNVSISLRSRARVGFGVALEKKADAAGDTDRKIFLQQALNSYLDVFESGLGKNLRGGEDADVFWVKTAGFKALQLIETLGVAPPDGFIDEMEALLPQLKESLEKKRAEFSQQKR